MAVSFAFVVVAPPEHCPTVTAPQLRASAQASVDWFVRNQDEDGTWLYLYNADDDLIAPEYNAVRHSGVTMGLYQAAAAGMPGALRSADRGTEWALDTLYEERRLGRGRVSGRGLDRRERAARRGACDPPGGHRRASATTMTCAASGASCSPRPSRLARCSRSTTRWPARPWRGSTPTTTRARPTGPWRSCTGCSPARAGARPLTGSAAYLATSRDEVEDNWPALPDHWAAYGAAETVEFPERGDPPLTDAEVDYGRRQAELFGSATRWVSQQFGPWGEVVRGGDTPRGGGYGVISEALTGWWLVAQRDPGLADLSEADRRARFLHRRAGG